MEQVVSSVTPSEALDMSGAAEKPVAQARAMEQTGNVTKRYVLSTFIQHTVVPHCAAPHELSLPSHQTSRSKANQPTVSKPNSWT